MIRIILVLTCILCSWSPSLAGRCGFTQMAEFQSKHPQGSGRMVAKEGTCTPGDLYDEVKMDTSRHFRVLYTLKGPHAVLGADRISQARPPFVDSLLQWLEDAWTLHTVTIGMRTPLGSAVSHHYQDERSSDKYPVEIIDMGLMRNSASLVGGPCEYCYGLTLPDQTTGDYTRSTLLIENDFLSQIAKDPLETFNNGFSTCTYSPSTRPIVNSYDGRNIDYSIDWPSALKVTVFHELYHACQVRYQDYLEQYHFWFEASAVGVENLGAPEVNDYFQYLPPIFSSPDNSLLESNNSTRPYGQGIFYQTVAHRFGIQFDPLVWTSLTKAPTSPIENHLDQQFKQNGASGGLPEVFSDHARHLFNAGARSANLSADSVWAEDLASWPELHIVTDTPQSLNLPPFGFQVFLSKNIPLSWGSNPALRKSAIAYKDSAFVILSTGFEAVSINDDYLHPDPVPKAWPNPWRPGNAHAMIPMCFDPASKDLVVEIRDAASHLVLNIPKKTLSRCSAGFSLSADSPRLAPGLYYWRGKSERKLHRFLIIR